MYPDLASAGSAQAPTVGSILDRSPKITGAEIIDHLVPPRQFASATLESYRPDPQYPSQAAALAAIRHFAADWAPSSRRLFSRRRKVVTLPGIYLDGGFGVGKTHLLAALWHAAQGRKYFGTFIEYTALVGALGYAGAARLLRGAAVVCIDEFELEDPGDTMMMTRLLSDLVESGTKIAATSNTPPNALGEGRFAASDFLREIQALSDRFRTIRIDGLDYRKRDIDGHAIVLNEQEFERTIVNFSGTLTVDDFDAVLKHLASVHPSRYIKMVDGLDGVGLRGVRVLNNQTDALRLVAFAARLYDAQVRVFSTGVALDHVFGDEMLAGGYRKKYLRAISRLIALTTDETLRF
jgi:cell division protein ZapE